MQVEEAFEIGEWNGSLLLTLAFVDAPQARRRLCAQIKKTKKNCGCAAKKETKFFGCAAGTSPAVRADK